MTLVLLLACVACHANQAKPQPATSMAHALETIAQCDILKTNPVLAFQSGNYRYRIERQGGRSIYSVTDGKDTLTEPLDWAMGLGFAGQTYIYQHNGQLYQSRVSFYRDVNKLDWTLGATNAKPADLTDAAGQLMDHDEKLACFGCHTTDAIHNKQLTVATLTPGVQCERCHGDTAHHLNGLKNGDPALAKMEDLKTFSTEQMSNFCGQCHRTWEQIATSGIHGVVNVRFQPYRLANSKCYDADDRRISCVACHDPHSELNRIDTGYDAKCQACHSTAVKSSAHVCKVSQTNCISCHMQKIEIPGSHHLFTDHNIRIVRTNAPYPD